MKGGGSMIRYRTFYEDGVNGKFTRGGLKSLASAKAEADALEGKKKAKDVVIEEVHCNKFDGELQVDSITNVIYRRNGSWTDDLMERMVEEIKKKLKAKGSVRSGSMAMLIDPLLLEGKLAVPEIVDKIKDKPEAQGISDLAANVRARLAMFKRRGYIVERTSSGKYSITACEVATVK